MIQSLRVKDFQGHKESVLEFCGGVNVIIGKSDAGKSSFLRGIYLVLKNRPTSTSYIRKGSASTGKRGAKQLGTAEVDMVIVEDGKVTKVSRVRGQGVNKYSCGDEEYDVVGRDVPEEVTQVLNLDSINLQRQHDQPFLVFESPGSVASTLNKFTNLDEVDEVVKILAGDLRAATAKKVTAEEQSTEIQKKIAAYDYLKSLEELVEVLEEIEAEYDEISESNENLKGLVEELKEADALLKGHQDKVKKLQPLMVKAVKLYEVIKEIDEKRVGKKGELERLSGVCRDIQDAQARLDEIEGALPVKRKALKLHKKVLSLEEEIELQKGQEQQVLNIIDDISNVEEELEVKKIELQDKQQCLKETKAELEKVDTCILCEQKLTKTAKKAMLRNLK